MTDHHHHPDDDVPDITNREAAELLAMLCPTCRQGLALAQGLGAVSFKLCLPCAMVVAPIVGHTCNDPGHDHP